jgi:hypothetical protein
VKVDIELSKADAGVRAKAKFSTTLSAHGVERPSLMFVSVADEVTVEAEVAFATKTAAP